MLSWSLLFALLAIMAGTLGYFVLVGIAAAAAKLFFLVFLILIVLSFLIRAGSR